MTAMFLSVLAAFGCQEQILRFQGPENLLCVSEEAEVIKRIVVVAIAVKPISGSFQDRSFRFYEHNNGFPDVKTEVITRSVAERFYYRCYRPD